MRAEYVSDRRDPDPATYHGLAAIAGVFHGWVEAYPDLRVEPHEIWQSDNQVFVWARFLGHGAGSGVAIDMERAQVWTMEAGRSVESRSTSTASRPSKPWAVGVARRRVVPCRARYACVQPPTWAVERP